MNCIILLAIIIFRTANRFEANIIRSGRCTDHLYRDVATGKALIIQKFIFMDVQKF